MKKLFIVLAVASLGFVACNNSGENKETTDTPAAPATETPAAPAGDSATAPAGDSATAAKPDSAAAAK